MSGAEQVIASVFWCCIAAVAFAYAGYPIVIYVGSRLFGRAYPTAVVSDDDLPRVSLLIVAHDEELVIETRLRNALASDYPADKLEIVVASDGCRDLTPAIVNQFSGRGVRLLHSPHRRGKSATINWAMPNLAGELVVLSDANTDVDPGAIRALVRWFIDPAVGVACGRLVLTDAATGRNADGVYWRYETFLKRCEGRLGALLGANGAIYAIRRSAFVPAPGGTVIDDFVIPLLAKLRTGCSIVYDRDAIAREETASDVVAEFARRARIGSGAFRSLRALAPLMNPARGWVAPAFACHKLLRWCCPFLMLGALACSVMLCRWPVYRAALVGQGAFYALAIVPVRARLPRAIRATQLFTMMNVALLVGFWRWLWDAQAATWQPTERAQSDRPPIHISSAISPMDVQ